MKDDGKAGWGEIPQPPSPQQQTAAYQPQPGYGQQSDYGQQSAYQQPGYGPRTYQQIPQVIVQMPEQKKSKAPWIIAIIVVVLLVAGCSFSFFACSRLTGSIMGPGETGIISKDTVAVIHMEGAIAASGSGYVTPEVTLSELQSAEDNSHVKAIVLRIDSGGGTVAASEEIAIYVKNCSKPVVVSGADSCASGAYMIASQADYIICLPSTTTGSIGVIMSLTNYKELMDKLGVSVENIASGVDKSAGSPYETLTDEDRAHFQALVNECNQQFIDIVAQGREGLDRAKVESLATGEVFSGTQAVGLGLIDATGTFEDACTKAAELGGMVDYDVVDFDSYTSSSLTLLDLLPYFL